MGIYPCLSKKPGSSAGHPCFWLFMQIAAEKIQRLKIYDCSRSQAMATNLYALNQWVIMPGTFPNSEELPEDLRRPAEVFTVSGLADWGPTPRATTW